MTTTDDEYTGVCIGEGCPVPHDKPDVSRETSPAPTGPEPLLEGKFAIYPTPAGSYHLVYRLVNGEEDIHFEIPTPMAAILNQMMAGVAPTGMMARVLRPILGRRG